MGLSEFYNISKGLCKDHTKIYSDALLGSTVQYKYNVLMYCQQFYNSKLGQVTSD